MASVPSGGIFSGADALTAVATRNGVYNWCLIGADATELPLAGGGAGGVEECKDCLKNEAGGSLFGLIRMSHKGVQDKFVFLFASFAKLQNIIGGVKKTGVGLKPAMESAFEKFVHIKVKMEVTDPEDFSIEHVLNMCQKASSADASVMTEKNYHETLEAYILTLPVEYRPKGNRGSLHGIQGFKNAAMKVKNLMRFGMMPDKANRTLTTGELAEQEAFEMDIVPQAEAAEPPPASPEDAPAAKPAEPPKSGEPVTFKKGDAVFVFGAQAAAWHIDGIVGEILTADGTYQGEKLAAGSIKVIYSRGTRGKWITPDKIADFILPGFGKAPPPAHIVVFEKQTHGLFIEWKPRLFCLKDGFFQYWKSKSQYDNKDPPTASFALWSSQYQNGPPLKETSFKVRFAAAAGLIEYVDAPSVESKDKFLTAFNAHRVYSGELTAYMAGESTISVTK